MKVCCCQRSVPSSDLERLGFVRSGSRDFDLTPGKFYLVIGLTCNEKPSAYGRGVILEVIDDFGRWSMAPICLFHVTDPRPSRYWTVQKYGDMGLQLLPESFFRDYYHDLLTDGDPEVVADFERVLSLLKAEQADLERGEASDEYEE
jgi:hypothetical protein